MTARQEHRTITDNNEVEHKYFVIQKPAMQGELLKFELVRMLGPAIGCLKEITTGGKVDKGKALEAFGSAIQSIFTTTDPDATIQWLQKLVINITRDEVRISTTNFDEIYTDNMMEFYKACVFVLEVNFANFFKGVKLGATLTKMTSLAK